MRGGSDRRPRVSPIRRRGEPGNAGRVGARRRPLAGGLALLALSAVGIAHAELYRCVDPSGHVRFTNDPAACPGTEPHEPDAGIQRIQRAPAPAGPAATRPSPDVPADPSAGQEAAWRARLAQARAEREELGAAVDHLREIVAWCNRGGSVAQKDASGLRHRVKCADVRSEYDQKEARLRSLDQYLQEGIHEECRRAGCLPGWLR